MRVTLQTPDSFSEPSPLGHLAAVVQKTEMECPDWVGDLRYRKGL